MDGLYQNRVIYSKMLADWLKKGEENEIWTQLEDLHIDEIDRVFEDNSVWFDSSIFLYEIIIEIVKKDFIVLLAIELEESDEVLEEVNFDYIKSNLSLYTPPSFYLFPVNDDRLKKTFENTKKLDLLNYENFSTYYKEEFDGEIYYRTLFIIDRNRWF